MSTLNPSSGIKMNKNQAFGSVSGGLVSCKVNHPKSSMYEFTNSHIDPGLITFGAVTALLGGFQYC